MSLADRLHPERFSSMSPQMAAIVAYILDEDWTEPAIAWISVTPDGHVTSDRTFLGAADDLDRNLLNLLIAAELTTEERAEFERRYRERVDDWRPALSGPAPAGSGRTRPDYSTVGVQV